MFYPVYAAKVHPINKYLVKILIGKDNLREHGEAGVKRT